MYPKPAIYKLESGVVTDDNILPMGHFQALPPLWPFQAEMVVVGGQQGGTSLWVYRHGNHTARAGCWGFSDQPSFHTNSSSMRSKPEHLLTHPGPVTQYCGGSILSDHPEQSKILTMCDLPSSPHWLAWHQSSSGSMPRVRLAQPTVGLCRTPSQASAITSCRIPTGLDGSLTE